jgi:KaiC/GvpD/RAD55 family RecA-like ATPase
MRHDRLPEFEPVDPETHHNKQEAKQEASPTPRSLRERLEAMGKAGPRIPTGIDLLDQLLRGGLRVEKTLVLGGAPGAGKTTLLLQIARNMARDGVAVAFVAADEEASGLDSRNLQSIGIDRDAAEEPTAETIAQAVAELEPLPLMILEDCTVEDAFKLLAEAHPDKPRCIMLDSLQTCQTAATVNIDNPRERIDDVVKTAKRLARQPDTRAIVMATSELARGAYRSKRSADATNDLAAFKESGGVEYGVHGALVLRSIEGSNTDVHAAMVKNRMGIRGDFMLYLNQQTATFTCAPAVKGGVDAADKTAGYRGRVCDAMDAVAAAPEGITSNRVHQKLGGRKETNLAALDELRAAGVIARRGDSGPWRLTEGARECWDKLQTQWEQADADAMPGWQRDRTGKEPSY